MSRSKISSPSERKPEPVTLLQKAVIAHVCVLLIFSSWAFGGQIPWARQFIAVWGGLGIALFIAACVARQATAEQRLHPAIRLLWPLFVYDIFVGVSGLNPSFIEVVRGDEVSLILGHPKTWLPSAARPVLAWKELWQFNVIVLSCFNLYLVVISRRLIRFTLLAVGGNAVALAIFGTFQKLVGSDGLWFGLVQSPNSKFFSTFIYHNHWGAFTLLNAGVCIGLLHYYIKRGEYRDLWHSPAPLGGLATLLLAATIPLSASRSSTALMTVLLFGTGVHLLLRLIRHRRRQSQSIISPAIGLIVAAVLAVGAIYYLSHEVIAQRAQLTAEQITAVAREDSLNSRLTLYRDTWRMAAEKPWFGWGLESYAHVFRIFNTQRAAELLVWIPFYAEAHNDWLQSLAEVGFIGTALFALLILIPLCSIPWWRTESSLPRYLLSGCGLVLVYAWLEFPFANPAVMIVFWCCYYSAVRYATLDRASSKSNQSTG